MGSPVRYVYYEKEMMGWIHEKMAIQESTPKGGRFSASLRLSLKTMPQLVATHVF
jgi:hypothetical protein